ncbi:MAG: asparagine synthase C-terminal domain-containing protein [Halobacteriota archaeon]
MSGIVGVVGECAHEALPKMCKKLAHRGRAHRSFRGELAEGTEFAISALGLATLTEVSNQHDIAVLASDSYHASYARARITNSSVLKLDRDILGLRPLFCGMNDTSSLCAFASERKALWSVGIKHPERVDPRTVVTISGLQNFDVNPKSVSTLSSKCNDVSKPVSGLRNVLETVLADIAHQQMCFAFSGGVDSALLCKLMPDCTNHSYYAVGLPGSHDLRSALHAASLLNIKVQTIELNVRDLEIFLPKVIEAIESCNPLDIAIALPFYVLAEQAKAAGFSSILTGQGADELFAGYSKYASLHSEPNDILNNVLERDVLSIARDNLERDNLAVAAHALDIVMPYLDPRVVIFGLAVDSNWKLHDGTNKYVLRRVAEQVMPWKLAYRKKKAIQYGTGVTSMLQRLARKKIHRSNSRGILSLYLRSIAEKQGIMVAA